MKLDVVVTVCGYAHETCPFFLRAARWFMLDLTIRRSWPEIWPSRGALKKSSWSVTARCAMRSEVLSKHCRSPFFYEDAAAFFTPPATTRWTLMSGCSTLLYRQLRT